MCVWLLMERGGHCLIVNELSLMCNGAYSHPLMFCMLAELICATLTMNGLNSYATAHSWAKEKNIFIWQNNSTWKRKEKSNININHLNMTDTMKWTKWFSHNCRLRYRCLHLENSPSSSRKPPDNFRMCQTSVCDYIKMSLWKLKPLLFH